MKTKILLCLIPLVPLACAANKSRRHILDREQRARLHRAMPRVYIKRVYRVADGQAEPGLYQVTLEGASDSSEQSISWNSARTVSAWTQKLNPFKNKTPQNDSSPEAEANRSIVRLEALLQSGARPLPAKFEGKGESGTLVQGIDLPEGCYEPVVAADDQGTLRLTGWRLVREHSGEIQPTGANHLSASAPQAADLFELVFENSAMIFRPVAGKNRPKERLPNSPQEKGFLPVKHDEANDPDSSSESSRSANADEKVLSELQSKLRQHPAGPLPPRVYPNPKGPYGETGFMMYYSPTIQPDEESK